MGSTVRLAGPGARSLRGPSTAFFVLASLFLGGCAATEEEPESFSEFLERNSNLLTELGSYQVEVSANAVRRVKGLGRDQGRALVLHLLRDPQLENYRVEVVLARILAEWKDPRAIPYLLQFLRHPDRGAAKNASEGLVVFGGETDVIEAFEEILEGDVVGDRELVADTLGAMKGPRAVELAVRHYPHEPDRNVRGGLFMAAQSASEPQRQRFLVEVLNDDDLSMRDMAWRALQQYRSLPKTDYRPQADAQSRAAAVAALRRWAGAEAQ